MPFGLNLKTVYSQITSKDPFGLDSVVASGAFVANLCKTEGRIAWRSLHVHASRVRLSAGASSAMTCTRIQLQNGLSLFGFPSLLSLS